MAGMREPAFTVGQSGHWFNQCVCVNYGSPSVSRPTDPQRGSSRHGTQGGRGAKEGRSPTLPYFSHTNCCPLPSGYNGLMTVTVSVSNRSSSNPDDSGVRLEIRDDTSRELVAEVLFTYEEFSRVLMNQQLPGIRARFGELARVGLERATTTKRSFQTYSERAEAQEFARLCATNDGPLQRTRSSSTNDGKTTVVVERWKKKA